MNFYFNLQPEIFFTSNYVFRITLPTQPNLLIADPAINNDFLRISFGPLVYSSRLDPQEDEINIEEEVKHDEIKLQEEGMFKEESKCEKENKLGKESYLEKSVFRIRSQVSERSKG